MPYKTNYSDPNGTYVLDWDTKTISELIGLNLAIDGEYILHRIYISCGSQEQLTRLAKSFMISGFKEAADVYLWDLCRDLANTELTAGRIIQDDYDLIDGLLPS